MSERIKNDAYYTPDPLAASLVSLLPLAQGYRVWEPHAGGGAFVRALTAIRCNVYASDIDDTATGLRHGLAAKGGWDARLGWPWAGSIEDPNWVIGNPPFTGFKAHIDTALATGAKVAFLLRLAVMASRNRANAWKRWPLRKVWVLAERPSFTGGKTDYAEYGFFWFDPNHKGTAEIIPGYSWKP